MDLFVTLPVQGIAAEIDMFEAKTSNASADASAYAQQACGLVFVKYAACGPDGLQDRVTGQAFATMDLSRIWRVGRCQASRPFFAKPHDQHFTVQVGFRRLQAATSRCPAIMQVISETW